MDATNYLSLLLQDNEQLKNLLGAYLNTMLLYKAKYSKNKEETEQQYAVRVVRTLDPQEKEQLLTIANTYRSYATRCYMSINSIQKKTTVEEFESIKSNYETIKGNLLPPYENAEEFTQSVNDVIVAKINISMFLLEQQKETELTKLYGESYKGEDANGRN